MALAYVGQKVPRLDAPDKVTGRAVYGVDLKLAGMLHGRILRSPLPHARITRIDTSKAEALIGVRAVVTGRDAPYTHNAAIIKDWCFFAMDKVRYVGEPVAAVAAIDEETAEEALGLIEVEYDELPAVFGAEEAMSEGAPIIHEELMGYPRTEGFHPVAGTNICNYYKLRRGDAEAAFADCTVLVEERYTTGWMQHVPMEVHVAIAQQASDGRLTVWTSAQSPYWTRAELATALGIPMSDIRVIVPHVGGGFGAKHAVKIEQYAITLAMKAGNRPVRVALTRAEEFGASLLRQPTAIDIKTGATREGRILARKIRIVWNTGGYADLSPAVSRNAGFAAGGPYTIPNVWVDSYCVYTNNPVSGAFRGFGVPEVTWAGESNLDMVARELGMDPLELRLRNAVEEGSESVLGEVLHSVGVKECLRKAADALDWTTPKPAGRGRGIACMHKSTGTPTSSAAFVKLNEDGTVTMLSSSVDMGQGATTVLAQIVAEELGVKPEHIRVVAPDTDVTPFDRSTTSSRTTFHSGNALRAAARDARQQILDVAGDLLEASPDDLELRDERVSVKGSPEHSVPLSKLWKSGMYTRGQYPILGRGAYSTSSIYDPLDPVTGRSRRATAFWMYAAQAAEVVVDLETGKVTVLRLTAAHDMGKAINPQTCQQQIEGALVMGLGQALFEQLVIDQGRPVNPSFIDYKIPCTLDIPQLETILVEAEHNEGPFGAKGLGEPGLAPTAAAIANAIFDAIGVRMRDLPITAERVIRALRERMEARR
ncbi:MAG: xanthine dehydrogenase family protein molybdopterin-binding subunit [Candidatus Rokuibacteriota bacterium]